jgi:endonuclease YncB( thermonuclease family)
MSRPRPAVLLVLLLTASCGASTPGGPARTPPTATPAPAGALLQAAPGGDGDSWKDTAGREYRLGLVNTPEVGACYGSAATARRKQLVARGFRAVTYSTDRYGRRVSVVTAADGTNVNVALARDGYADDRYFSRFRDERPELAAQLDVAFAAAKRDRAGLWGACPAASYPAG